MRNPYIIQSMMDFQNILNGTYQSCIGLSSASVGKVREAFIDNFLSKVFPPIYRFGSGDATDSYGRKSGQLDVVIEYPFSPSLPLTNSGDLRLYIAESIAAVVEVKSDISNQLDQAVYTAQQLYPLQRRFYCSLEFSPDKFINMDTMKRIPLFVASYTGWKNPETVKKHLDNHPEIFGILIIDSGCYVSKRMMATGEFALWGFISDIHKTISCMQSASTNALDYVIDESIRK